ncbi:MAG: dephospho-CoA kinase [Actinomycetota bacterium]|nr:dephospho-CoA kinase [Actinomycetota bacterium]MDD5665783.1 dephospho-CoA kinase [Actinomycetota bacterium]
MFVIALTGGIASGKSTVCDLLAEKGAYILCSDLLAREVVRKGEPAWRDIVDHFGEGVLDEEGEIDRARLAEIVFSDPGERSFLNSVTHPRIFQLMFDRLRIRDEESGGEGVAVLDIPLLVDVKAAGMFDFTLVVDASPEAQLERITRDRGSSREEALSRIEAQVPRAERLAHADHVIRNEGSLEDLRREVDEAWEAIMRLAAEKR